MNIDECILQKARDVVLYKFQDMKIPPTDQYKFLRLAITLTQIKERYLTELYVPPTIHHVHDNHIPPDMGYIPPFVSDTNMGT